MASSDAAADAPLPRWSARVFGNLVPDHCSLLSFLTRRPGRLPAPRLLLPSDSPSYATLLCSGVVGWDARDPLPDWATAPVTQAPGSESGGGGGGGGDDDARALRQAMLRLVYSVVEETLLNSDRRQTALSCGFRRIRPDSGAGVRQALFISCVDTNTTVTALLAPEWLLLLRRVGPAIMRHLLAATSLFAPLPNRCFAQLSGQLVYFRPHALQRRIRERRAERERSDKEEAPPLAAARRGAAPTDASGGSGARGGLGARRLRRSSMLFCNETAINDCRGLPNYHALNRIAPNASGARRLLALVFRCTLAPHQPTPPSLRRAAELLERLLRNHRRCNYRGLLLQHCPLPARFAALEPAAAARGAGDVTAGEDKRDGGVGGGGGGGGGSGSISGSSKIEGNTEACDASPDSDDERDAGSPRRKRARPESAQELARAFALSQPWDSPPATPSEECDERDAAPPQPKLEVPPAPSMSATEAARIAEEAAAAHTSPDAVCAFLRHALLRVVPGEFWGSKRNLRVLCDNVRRLVTLRRHETLSVAQLLHGFKLGDCAWLLPCGGARRGPLSRAQRHGATQRLACWLEWLFEQLLIPLLRASFYCTDSEPLLNRVLFYRRPLWEVLQRTALDELRRAQFQELGPEEVRALAERGRRTLGVGLLRLRPRVIGLRPIVNLSRKVDRARILAAATAAAAVGAGCSRPPAAPPCVAGGAALSRLDSDLGVGGLEDDDAPARGSRFPAVNEALRPVFEVLKFERERRPALLGASVFGHGDIFAALREFSARVRGQKSESATEPLVFAVAVDVRKCFDTIDRARLLELVEEALREPHYFTQKLSVVYPKLDQVRTRFKFLAGLPGDMPLFFEEAARRAERTDSAVLSDHVFRQVHSRETLLARLRRHLSDSVVRIQDSFLRQAVGVPQGSVVSAFLACLYLAAVERAHILPALNRAAAAEAAELPTASPSSSPSTQPPRLLLRHMDDFLLLTQSRAEAEAFVAAMHRGFADLGVAVNPAKTKTNFAPQPSDAAPQLLPPARLVPWNGLVLDTDTVEVRADYARYGRAELRDSMTVESHTHPGEGLARALRRFLQHRCQPLLLDGRLNSPRTVALNVFQLTLLAGLKLVAYADGLRQLRADALRNQRFLAATVLDAIEYAWAVAATRVRLVSAELRRRRVSSPECALPLSRAEFHWLGFQALLLALSRRRASLPLVAAALADAAARAAREAGDSALVSAKLLRELVAESAALLELGARTRGAAGGGSGVALR